MLAELLSAHRAANRQAYFGVRAHLTLSTFGPGLWPLLRQGEAVGLDAGARRATCAGWSWSPRAGVPAGRRQRRRHRARAHVGIGVDLDGEWFAGDSARGARRHRPRGGAVDRGRRPAGRLGGGAGAAGPASRRADPPADRGRPAAARAERTISTTWSATSCRGCSATCRWCPPTRRCGCRSRPSRGSRSRSRGRRSTRCTSPGPGATASAPTTASTGWTSPAGCAGSADRTLSRRSSTRWSSTTRCGTGSAGPRRAARSAAGADLPRTDGHRVRRGHAGAARGFRAGGDRGGRRPAGLPRADRRAGDPVRAAWGDRRRRRPGRPHRLARPRGGGHRSATASSVWRSCSRR